MLFAMNSNNNIIVICPNFVRTFVTRAVLTAHADYDIDAVMRIMRCTYYILSIYVVEPGLLNLF